MMTFVRPLALLTVAASLLFAAGCGTVPGAGAGVVAQMVGGQKVVKLGFGVEGGDDPAVIRRADGSWVLAYVGTYVENRRLYVATSPDGSHFNAGEAIEEHVYSDQSPSLVEDGDGKLHLFFASNRDGANFELYHSFLDTDGSWAQPTAVPGFTGVQNLAVSQRDGRFLMAAEVMGDGLFVSTSADGAAWTERELVAEAGFEPAATFTADGTAVVAYQRSGQIFVRSSRAGGAWSEELTAAQGEGRLRQPALAWTEGRGVLVFCERGADGYVVRRRHFDTRLTFTDGPRPPALTGEARTPAVSYHNGKIGLAWGMKLPGGQQGIVFALAGDR